MNNLRQLRVLLYRLQRSYGKKIYYLRTGDATVNSDTGAVTRDDTVITIPKAIMLLSRAKQDFIYDLSFIAANKNFTYGGLFDRTTAYFIINGKYLDVEPNPSDYIEVDSSRYNVKSGNLMPDNISYLVTATKIESATTQRPES